MAQRSWPWSTVAGLGDGAAELNEAYSREFLALYFGVQNPAVEGVSVGVLNELAVTGIATPLAVGSGSAICYGLYVNDANTTIAVTTPAIGTTGGRVVLRTNWAGTGGAGLEARTRIAVKMSADGNPAIPALTQAFGTTWEISLANFLVTTLGVITVTDERTFRRSTAMVETDGIVDSAVTILKINNDAVTDAKLRNSAGLSVIGRSAAGAGDPADIAAGTDNYVLRRSGATIGFGQVATDGIANVAVTTGKLANDSVDDTKAGNRVPQFYRRQGSSATVWSSRGTTSYTPTSVRMQAGAMVTDASGDCTITFPTAYSNLPLVILTPWNDVDDVFTQVVMNDISATTFRVQSFNAAGAKLAAVGFNWLAVGPE